QSLLTRQLAGTVHTEWSGLRIWRVGLRGAAVEDEVGGDVHEAHGGCRDEGEVAHAGVVDGKGLRRFTFRLVHLCVGSAVDYHVWRRFMQHAAQELHVANVADRRSVSTRLHAWRRGAQHLLAQLSACSQYQDTHVAFPQSKVSAAASTAALRSLSESSTSRTAGQLMASAGSFHS